MKLKASGAWVFLSLWKTLLCWWCPTITIRLMTPRSGFMSCDGGRASERYQIIQLTLSCYGIHAKFSVSSHHVCKHVGLFILQKHNQIVCYQNAPSLLMILLNYNYPTVWSDSWQINNIIRYWNFSEIPRAHIVESISIQHCLICWKFQIGKCENTIILVSICLQLQHITWNHSRF